MAATLIKIYDLIKKEGGLPAQMRLAMTTGIPSAKANEVPDSADNVAKFKAAFKQIMGKDVAL